MFEVQPPDPNFSLISSSIPDDFVGKRTLIDLDSSLGSFHKLSEIFALELKASKNKENHINCINFLMVIGRRVCRLNANKLINRLMQFWKAGKTKAVDDNCEMRFCNDLSEPMGNAGADLRWLALSKIDEDAIFEKPNQKPVQNR